MYFDRVNFNRNETRLIKEIAARFEMAKGEVTAMRLDGLGFMQADLSCDMRPQPGDMPAKKAEIYTYNDHGYRFEIARLGKALGQMVEIVILNGNYKPHIHHEAAARLWVLEGKGIALMDGVEIPFSKGMAIEARAGMAHGFITEEKVALLSVQSRPILCRKEGTRKKHIDFDATPEWPCLSHAARTAYNANRHLRIAA